MDFPFLYINLDGFAGYYFDLIQERQRVLPALSFLIQEGTYFENIHTGIPSITFPMQSAIVSGAYSGKTGNCYQYLNRENNTVILCKRLNRAQTVAQVLKEQQIPCLSIQQFALEGKGCSLDDPQYLYVQPGGDYAVRFDLLDRLIEENRITCNGSCYRFDMLPGALFLYLDDLDTIGHNPAPYRAGTESGRVQNVIDRLKKIDTRLFHTLSLLKQKGLYDRMTILLTTDHGMIPFTGESRIDDLIRELHLLGFARVSVCSAGEQVSEDWDVLLTSHGIQCQLYVKDGRTDLNMLKRQLEPLYFADQVLTKQELMERGGTPLYADLLISPPEGMHFNIEHRDIPVLAASHDSLHPKCSRVFAVMKGPRIKKNYTMRGEAQVIDLMPTLCKATGIPVMKEATGRILNEILIG